MRRRACLAWSRCAAASGCCGRRGQRRRRPSRAWQRSLQTAEPRFAAATTPFREGLVPVTEASLAVSAKRRAARPLGPQARRDRRLSPRPDRADHAGDRGPRRRRPRRCAAALLLDRGSTCPAAQAAPRRPTLGAAASALRGATANVDASRRAAAARADACRALARAARPRFRHARPGCAMRWRRRCRWPAGDRGGDRRSRPQPAQHRRAERAARRR